MDVRIRDIPPRDKVTLLTRPAAESESLLPTHIGGFPTGFDEKA